MRAKWRKKRMRRGQDGSEGRCSAGHWHFIMEDILQRLKRKRRKMRQRSK